MEANCPMCNDTGTRWDGPGIDSIGPCGCPAGKEYKPPSEWPEVKEHEKKCREARKKEIFYRQRKRGNDQRKRGNDNNDRSN